MDIITTKNVLSVIVVTLIFTSDVVPSSIRFIPSNINGNENVFARNTVTYQVINAIKVPTFDNIIRVKLPKGEPFIRYMEKAANLNDTFNFSADYYSRLGYFITTIHNRTSNKGDGTFWNFMLAPNRTLPVGVSTYKPKSGDHIIFRFTKYKGGL